VPYTLRLCIASQIPSRDRSVVCTATSPPVMKNDACRSIHISSNGGRSIKVSMVYVVDSGSGSPRSPNIDLRQNSLGAPRASVICNRANSL